jgi:uncharacterized protein YukE
MSASSAFVDLLDQLDMWWPEGDGSALRVAADGWNKTADLIDEITAVLGSVAGRLTDNYRGEAADRFTQTWAKWVGEAGYLGLTSADCRRLAAALMDFANDVDVADRTLVQFIEQALGAAATNPNPVNPMMLPQEWLTWLQASGAQLFAHLAAQTNSNTAELDAQVGNCCLPPAPGDRPDLSTIISTNISWPDPGKPTDMTALATGEINFGAGQGFLPTSFIFEQPPGGVGGGVLFRHLLMHQLRGGNVGTQPTVLAPPPANPTPPSTAQVNVGTNSPTAGTPSVGIPPVATSTPLQQFTTPVIEAPLASTQMVAATTALTTPSASPSIPTPPSAGVAAPAQPVNELTAPLSDAAFDKLVDDMLGGKDADAKAKAAALAKPAAAAVIAKPKAPPKSLLGLGSVPPLRTLKLSSIPDAVPTVADIGTESVSFGGPAIPAAAGAAAATAAAASKKAGSGFPMMPLGGGSMSGGDDNNEPKRRSRKRALTPPPIVE